MKKQRRQHEEEHSDETWLIPYADLLTLLLALFIVLFASSQIDQKKFDELGKSLNAAFHGGETFFESATFVPISEVSLNTDVEAKLNDHAEPPPLDAESQARLDKFNQETVDLENLKQKLDAYIHDNGLLSQLETKLGSQQLTITIRDNALFASGSANVRQDAQQLGVTISNMLAEYPQYEIVVSGHTDDRPINTVEFPSNWDLSLKRAGNFMKVVLANAELDPKRFSAVGYGEYRPIETNKTAEGRGANRRVEVSIIRTIQDAPDEVIAAQ